MFKRENAWKWVTAALLAYGFFGCTPAEATGRDDSWVAYRAYAKTVAVRHGLPEGLVAAICLVESSWRPYVVGSAGEIGLCQMKPGTLRMFTQDSAENLFDPFFALDYAGRYLAWLSKTLGPRDSDVLAAAYNQGPYSSAVVYMMKVRRGWN